MKKPLFLFVLLYFLSNPAFAGYSYIRSITVNHSQLSGGSDLTQFPILVCGNGPSPCNVSISGLNQSGTGAHVTNASGYDIIFTTDAACTTELTWEMENYVASTGEFEAWVTNTSTALSHSADTTFYMCYGNPAITTLQSTAANVWDSNYKGVYHLSTNAITTDSTGTQAATSNSETSTPAKIDGGANFVKTSSQYMDIGQTATHYNPISVEVWIYETTLGTTVASQEAVTKGSNGSITEWEMTVGNVTNSKISWDTYVGAGNHHYGVTSAIALSATTWYFVVGTYDGTNWHLYINGSEDANSPVTAEGPQSTAQKMLIGAVESSGTPVNFWNGDLDEVRISNAVRSAGWIATEYNNQGSPASFYTVGPEWSTGPHYNSINGVTTIRGASTFQ